ncbi:MAG: hypothetical protein R2776_03960 [Flavobacteriaceae bacterium]|nr:hypothetical protein [Flavobacteriaceae bacterium]
MNASISSRRKFIAKTALALTGTTLLTSVKSFASLFNNGTAHYLLKGYQEIPELKNDLRTAVLGKTLKVSGTLFSNEATLQPCSNALIEVWHLSSTTGDYQRGKLITDENGRFTFWADFPHKEKGFYPRFFFKATKEEKTELTELILDSHQAHISHTHWEKNKELGEKLFPKHSPSPLEGEIEFNFIIN